MELIQNPKPSSLRIYLWGQSKIQNRMTLLLVLNLVVPSFFSPRYPQVPYSDFISQVEAGKVERAIVGGDRIQYVMTTQTPDGKTVEQVYAVGLGFALSCKARKESQMLLCVF